MQRTIHYKLYEDYIWAGEETCVHCGLISEFFANSAMTRLYRNILRQSPPVVYILHLYTTVRIGISISVFGIHPHGSINGEYSIPSAQQTAAA